MLDVGLYGFELLMGLGCVVYLGDSSEQLQEPVGKEAQWPWSWLAPEFVIVKPLIHAKSDVLGRDLPFLIEKKITRTFFSSFLPMSGYNPFLICTSILSTDEGY